MRLGDMPLAPEVAIATEPSICLIGKQTPCEHMSQHEISLAQDTLALI